MCMEENPSSYSLRGRPVPQVNYKEFATWGRDEMEQDNRSVKSIKSAKSTKSTRSWKGRKVDKERDAGKSVADHESSEQDSDIELQQLDKEIEANKPSFSEQYNEFKVRQGEQDLLEDADLPEDLDQEETYRKTKDLHLQQKKATTERMKRAEHRLELTRLREEIVETRERARTLEWEADMMEREKRLKANSLMIERRKRERRLKEMEEQQEREYEELNDEYGRKTLEYGKENLIDSDRDSHVSQERMTIGHDKVKSNRRGMQSKQSNAYQVKERESVMRALFTQQEDAKSKSVKQRNNNKDSQVAEWVSAHSHMAGDELDELQERARKIIAQKTKTRPVRVSAKAKYQQAHVDDSSDEEDLGEVTGVEHLRKLGLVLEKFGEKTLQMENEKKGMQTRSKTGRNNLQNLGTLEIDSVSGDIDGKGGDCPCGARPKVKSGKFAKTNVNLVKQEVWPHTMVSKKYTKRTTFDMLEFEAFVAGETKIIHSLLVQRKLESVGRLKVLMMISHWLCKSKNWPMVKSLYEAIMEEIESGEANWEDDFSSYETMLTPLVTMGSQVTDSKSGKKQYEVYWCKAYQTGNCEVSAPHMAQIKPDEPMVAVLHICATCWSLHKKRREHAEQDCPTKK